MIRNNLCMLLLITVIAETMMVPDLSIEAKAVHLENISSEMEMIQTETIVKTDPLIEAIGNITNENKIAATDKLNILPESFKNAFHDNGWHLYLTDENIAMTEFDGAYLSVRGVTKYEEKCIKLENREDAISGALIHEFGHFLDFNKGMVSSSEEWKMIKQSEQQAALEQEIVYEQDNETEYFAKCFSYYMLYSEEAKENMPKTSDFLQGLLDSYDASTQNINNSSFYISTIPLNAELQQYIFDTCSSYGVDPYVIIELIRRESSFQEDAENGECKGLTQVSEKWHADRMVKLGCDNIFDPKQNILLCVDFIHELHSQNEDMIYVLMRYNMKKVTADKLYEEGNYSDYAIKILENAEALKAANLA